MSTFDSSPKQFLRKKSRHRSGQINFGLVQFSSPDRPSWKPTGVMFVSKPEALERNHASETCHPNPKWIQTESELKSLINWLESQDEFCLHVRCCSHNAVMPYTTLIQISTWGRGDFLIDAMPLQDVINRTCKQVLENPNILKIMCDSKCQVYALQRDFSIYIHSIADVLELVKINIPEVNTYGLLCKKYTPIQFAELAHTSSNMWIMKSSHDDHIHYVTHQVHFVLRIFNRLRNEGRRQELAQCFANSRLISETVFQCLEENVGISPFLATSRFIANLEQKKEEWTRQVEFQNFTEESKNKIVAVIEYREVISKALNIIPEIILTDRNIFLQCCSLTQDPAMLSSYIDDRLPYFTGIRKTLLMTLLRSHNPKQYMEEFRAHQCQNCWTTGHGLADLCIFPRPPDNTNFIEYLLCPGNEESKKAYDRQLLLFVNQQRQRKQEILPAVQLLDRINW